MEELVETINLAMEQFKQEYGDDAKLEDGDEQAWTEIRLE